MLTRRFTVKFWQVENKKKSFCGESYFDYRHDDKFIFEFYKSRFPNKLRAAAVLSRK